jgi:hypothetical protein
LPEVVTLIDWVVAPLDHRYDVPEEAVSVTLPPWQKVVGPLAVMVAEPPEEQAVPCGVNPVLGLTTRAILSISSLLFEGVIRKTCLAIPREVNEMGCWVHPSKRYHTQLVSLIHPMFLAEPLFTETAIPV